jgi:hypothetical protein
MKKVLLFIFNVLISCLCLAQSNFKNGYIIDNDNKKISCLIRNVNSLVNPAKVKYKTASDGEVLEAEISEIREFGTSEFRFIRSVVEIDQSTSDEEKMDDNRFPVWKTDTVFLRQIVDGKASLFQYQTGEMERYFFSVDEGSIKQLIYKQFIVLTNQGGFTHTKQVKQLRINGGFVNQLEKEVKCGPSKTDQKPLKFSKATLTEYFLNYNSCIDKNSGG